MSLATAKVTEEYKQEMEIAHRLQQWSYAKRLRVFIDKHSDLRWGMASWYSDAQRLMFPEYQMAEWFTDGEDKPCVMRGSIYALDFEGHGVKVFKRQVTRWIRTRRITCLDGDEWEGMVYLDFWKERADHLKQRYYRACRRWNWVEWLHLLVNAWPNRPYMTYPCQVLIDGVFHKVDREQLFALRELRAMERKIRKAA